MIRVGPRPPAVHGIQGIFRVQQDCLRHAVEIVIVVLDLHAVAVDGDFLQQPLAARAIVRTVSAVRAVAARPLSVVDGIARELSGRAVVGISNAFPCRVR